MSTSTALSISDICERHPWPKEILAYGKPLEWTWQFDVDAKPETLWKLLIDTTRLNRALGLTSLDFEEREGVLHGSTTILGSKQEWIEIPWNWVSGEYLIAVRDYSRGFSRMVRVCYMLEDLGNGKGCRVHTYFGWVTRGFWGTTLLKLAVPQLQKKFAVILEELAKESEDLVPEIFKQAPEPASAEAMERARDISEQLLNLKFDDALVSKLIDFVLTGDDLDVYRIQIRSLAKQWKVDEDDLLRLALHATRLGLLDLSWDVICPHCRGVQDELQVLATLPDSGCCDVCAIDFATDRSNSIEITFHVHASIRHVERLFYCSAEPSSKMHILVQQELAPGETRVVTTRLAKGRYRLRIKGVRKYSSIAVNEEGDASTAWDAAAADTLQANTGPAPTLTLVNSTDAPQTFVVETETWIDAALRPGKLFASQEFRDLFSEEYLASDVPLTVGEQTILFTDMIGSTKFYAAHGDPEAFMVVKRHFSDVFSIIADNRGALVKTIGDAAMAVFGDPVDALRASKQIHDRFHKDTKDTPIRLRISLHAGPCIAVNLNTAIDYFGNTVNLAAKLQACAESGQIAMSDTVAEAPGVREYLESEHAELETLPYASNTSSGDVAVTRWSTWAE